MINSDYIISTPPVYAGWYSINNEFSFSLTKKPAWIHRKMAKWLLGWEWKDYEI